MKESQNTASKAERLKDILKGFGIKTAKDLDEALSGALGAMTIGIMTERPVQKNFLTLINSDLF